MSSVSRMGGCSSAEKKEEEGEKPKDESAAGNESTKEEGKKGSKTPAQKEQEEIDRECEEYFAIPDTKAKEKVKKREAIEKKHSVDCDSRKKAKEAQDNLKDKDGITEVTQTIRDSVPVCEGAVKKVCEESTCPALAELAEAPKGIPKSQCIKVCTAIINNINWAPIEGDRPAITATKADQDVLKELDGKWHAGEEKRKLEADYKELIMKCMCVTARYNREGKDCGDEGPGTWCQVGWTDLETKLKKKGKAEKAQELEPSCPESEVHAATTG